MSERKIEFKLGTLDLVLMPALTSADVARLISFRDPQYRRAHPDETYETLLDLLLKCARERHPKLTKDELEDQLNADTLGAVTIVLHQLAGIIPTEEN